MARPTAGYQASITYSNIITRLVSPDNRVRDGGSITGRPRANGSLFHKYSFQEGALRGFSLNNALVWVDGNRADSISGTTGLVTNYIPGYTRLDFGAGYAGKLFGRNCTVTASMRNATNLKIMEGLQSKGDLRSYRLGVSTKF
jgi:hypothetical protein